MGKRARAVVARAVSCCYSPNRCLPFLGYAQPDPIQPCVDGSVSTACPLLVLSQQQPVNTWPTFTTSNNNSNLHNANCPDLLPGHCGGSG